MSKYVTSAKKRRVLRENSVRKDQVKLGLKKIQIEFACSVFGSINTIVIRHQCYIQKKSVVLTVCLLTCL